MSASAPSLDPAGTHDRAPTSPALGRSLVLALGVLFATWGAILFSFKHQVALILEAWETLPSHAHGYVVLLITAYLLWTRRAGLKSVVCSPSWKGVLALLLIGFVALLGELVSLAAVVQFSLVFMLIAAVWAILGDRAARVTLGPLSFLLFAVPFGHEALPYLMNWTADATVLALRASGIPVFQEGRNFVIPSGRWSVVEACGGVRYLLSSVFIGAVFAYLTYTRWQKRALFMVWAVVMPLIANWLRAYVIVMVAHYSNNEWGTGLSHLTLGWVIFGIAIFVGFAVGARWRDPVPAPPSQEQGKPGHAGSFVVAGLAAALIPYGWYQIALELDARSVRPKPMLMLTSLAGVEVAPNPFNGIRPAFPGAASVHQASYRHDGTQVDVFVAYFRNQRQGAELVSVLNKLEPSDEWNWAISARPSVPSAVLPRVRFEGYLKEGVHAAMYHLYWVNGQTTTNDSVSKALEALSRLRGRGDDAAAIAVTAYSTESLELARSHAESFAVTHLQGVLADLERTASSTATEGAQ